MENNIEDLRLKTEKSDLRQYLKSSIGGYTKESVQEYISVMRKQQQMMADTFAKNQQALYDEKEDLKKKNETLTLRIAQAEAEYANLAESLKDQQLTDEDISTSDIINIKNRCAVLEQESNKSAIDKEKLRQLYEQQNELTGNLKLKLEQTSQEKQAILEMLRNERLESAKLRTSVSQLTGKIDENDQEIKFLSAQMTEGEVAELSAKVKELTQQISDQAEFIARVNDEKIAKDRTVEIMTGEIEMLRQTVGRISLENEKIAEQNQKIELANKYMTQRLTEEYGRSIDLIKDKSSVIIEKINTDRKFEETKSKMSYMEIKLKKYESLEDQRKVYESGADINTATEIK